MYRVPPPINLTTDVVSVNFSKCSTLFLASTCYLTTNLCLCRSIILFRGFQAFLKLNIFVSSHYHSSQNI